jgi:hypothetical protein
VGLVEYKWVLYVLAHLMIYNMIQSGDMWWYKYRLSHRQLRKKQLDAVLLSYNLTATVHFPTKVQNQSSMATDNILIVNYKFTKYTVSPIYNGLSDYDAQLLTIK